MQADEALFSVDAYVQRHWAPPNNPITKTSRWGSSKPIVVFGVISAARGVVYWHYAESSFSAQDICDALTQVRAEVGNEAKIALALDNASIHRAKIVQQLIATPEVAIEPLWNLAARPDLLTVGIEQVWARAKYLYRC